MSKIDQIKSLLSELESPVPYNIGIGITTHNRNELFVKSYEEIKRLSPGCRIVVVDDSSTIPVKGFDYRFGSNVGIAKAKNKCLELLYKAGCEHFFLFDDDTYPLKENWFVPYVESDEPHLCYIFKDFATGRRLNDTIEIYRDSKKVAYSHSRGCMLYYHRSCLDRVGGMDEVFGKWGFEHPSLSDRIYMAGLTSFRYMDIPNSKGLFYSDDEQRENKNTSVTGTIREEQVKRNRELYNARKYTCDYIPFYEKENILLTSYFTNIPDPQRKQKWNFNPDVLEPLIKSVGKKEKLVILSDHNEHIPVLTQVETSVNPYFQRWISYREYLIKNRKWINNVICVDATDVELINPIDWDTVSRGLVTGDEPDNLSNEWMLRNHPHVTIQEFFKNNRNKQILNAGILGGNVETVIEFIRQLLDFWAQAVSDSYFVNEEKYNPGIGDMGVFNYIAYSNWKEKLITGRQVCTEFKKYESNNYSWFKHK